MFDAFIQDASALIRVASVGGVSTTDGAMGGR